MLRYALYLALSLAVGCTSFFAAKKYQSVSMRMPANTGSANFVAALSAPLHGSTPQEKFGLSAQRFGALFGLARTQPYHLFKQLREHVVAQNNPVFSVLPEGVALTNESGAILRQLPPVVVIPKHKDVLEVLGRNREFQVYPNRENMNNTVGYYMLAYEGEEQVGADHQDPRLHPGSPQPHGDMNFRRSYSPQVSEQNLNLPASYTINFADEKSHMWRIVNRAEDKPRIRAIARQAVKDGIRAAGNTAVVDVVEHITRGVPLAIVMNYFGIKPTENNVAKNKRLLSFWSRWTQNSFFHNPTRDGAVNAMAIYAMRGLDRYKAQTGENSRPTHPITQRPVSSEFDKGMDEYVKELILRRQGFLSSFKGLTLMNYYSEVPEDERATVDLLILAEPFHVHAGVNSERLISNVMGMLVGTVETGAAAIAQALEVILNDASIRQMLESAIASNDQNLMNKIVWEALRFNPVNPWVARIAMAPTQIGGTDVLPGTLLLVSTESAMMDEEVFEDPTIFKTDRDKELYLHMGAGRHQCLGYDVAYEFVSEAVVGMFQELPILRKAIPGKDLSFQYPGTRNPDFHNPFPESFALRQGDPVASTVMTNISNHMKLYGWFYSQVGKEQLSFKNQLRELKESKNTQSVLTQLDSVVRALQLSEGDLYASCMDYNDRSSLNMTSVNQAVSYCQQPFKFRFCHANEVTINDVTPALAYDQCVTHLSSRQRERVMAKNDMMRLFN